MAVGEAHCIKVIREIFVNCNDFSVEQVAGGQFTILHIVHLMDTSQFHQVMTAFVQDADSEAALTRLLKTWNPIEGHTEQDLIHQMKTHILNGDIVGVYKEKVWMISAGAATYRSIQPSSKEAIITGPHDAFVESSQINASLIRRRIRSTKLKVIKYNIGENIPFYVHVMYMEGIAEKEVVQEANKRVQNLHMEYAWDGNEVGKRMDDTPYSLFPQWLATERPDTVANYLMNGKVAIITDQSPTVIIAPVGFLDFFAVTGDSYERWHFGRYIRLLRLFAFTLTLMLSAFYVAVTTYHYQFIPPTLLETIVVSRLRVPFEPMMEALVMEGVIEILREAGARLPTKIAQTIGIVGGLVIGQAIVQAGLTGNVLIVVVASSALASFIVPNYTMETSMRALRFVNISLAGLMGYFGIVIFVAVLATRLCHIRSLNKEYLMFPNFIEYIYLSRDKRPKSVVQKPYFRRGGRMP